MQPSTPPFELWLEFEQVEQPRDWDPTCDFANVKIILDDGREYTLNVWTYDFLPIARESEIQDGEWGNFTIPPDLFVKELTRECLESVVAELLLTDGIPQIPGVEFGIAFTDPWTEAWQLDDLGDSLELELKKELGPGHPLHGIEFSILAVAEGEGKILVDFGENQVALVHLNQSGTTEIDPFPMTRIYPDLEAFWKEVYAKDE